MVRRSAQISLVLASLACGPLGPLAGGALSGPVAPAGEAMRCDVHTIQVETGPADPHSVNTWCGHYEGHFYVPTSLILGAENPLDRTWVRNVAEDDRVRIRIDGKVWERRAVRVTDAAELEGARAALLAKYTEDTTPHASAAWIFRMDSR